MAHPMTTLSAKPAPAPQIVESHEILAGARKILIRHGDDLYTLQVTRQGKLLLTK